MQPLSGDKKIYIISLSMIGLAAALWGLDGVVLTPRLNNLHVFLVVFLLHALPFLVMNFVLFKHYKELKKLDTKALYSLVWVSVFGGALGTIAIVYALFIVNFQQLSVVVLLQKFQPVFAILLATILLKEKLSKNFLAWGIVAVLGGYLLTFGFHLPYLTEGNHTAQAALLSLLASFSFASSTVFSKNLLDKVNYISATFFRYGLTAILMLFVVLISGHLMEVRQVTETNWWVLAIISVTTGTGAILLYYYGLKHVKASHSTLMELFFPITTIVLDYFVNGVMLSPIQWISASVMVFAILKASAK
ncbi:MAG: EamA family transporter [Flavobacteriaceae bacterium]|nr:EamA family transporter [Flavobacteriaceae bacterium]